MADPWNPVPVLVLGATGYVAGELLRLIALHPHLELALAVSTSQAGAPVEAVFPGLRGLFPDAVLQSPEDARRSLAELDQLAVFSATPHGQTAALVAEWVAWAEDRGVHLDWVDLSADFRLGSADRFTAVYGVPHGAPELLEQFQCGLPDLDANRPARWAAHPGCFTTAITLALAPLHAAELAAAPYAISAVTGSTGSGRTPSSTTHHPERHGNLRAYRPLRHRHETEITGLLGRLSSPPPEVSFVAHSGPFARGIHATVQVELHQPMDAADLATLMAGYYAQSPFVHVDTAPPELKHVVGTNRCELGVAVRGRHAVVLSVIDNLVKGAAGGAMQWMNRILGLPDATGLLLPATSWA